MIYDIQPAPFLKRVSAFILDIILLATLAVGVSFLASKILNVDKHQDKLQEYYDYYEATYDVKFDLSQEEFDALSDEDKARYNEVEAILQTDEGLIKEYNIVINLTLIVLFIGVLVAVMSLEFVIPIILKNGQTIGKKVFAIGLVRNNSVKITNMQLFVRTIFGKFLIDLMIPIYIIVALFYGLVGKAWAIFLVVLWVFKIVLVSVTKNRTAVHDVLAYTVVCDLQTQKFFDSEDDLLKYKEKVHEEEVAKIHTY